MRNRELEAKNEELLRETEELRKQLEEKNEEIKEYEESDARQNIQLGNHRDTIKKQQREISTQEFEMAKVKTENRIVNETIEHLRKQLV